MSLYYLMSQLPSLDVIGDTVPLPITEERFLSLCESFAGKRAYKVLSELSLTPPRKRSSCGFKLVDDWYDCERKLRLSLGEIRAGKMKKEFENEDTDPAADITQAALTASLMTDPLEAERYLNGFRLGHLELMRPIDAFSDSALFYYAIKLKLLSRIKQFDTSTGQQIYQNIYASVVNGDGQEAEE